MRIFELELMEVITVMYLKELEWISDSKVDALTVAETANVIEPRFIRHVQAYSPVETDNEEVEIVAQTDTGAQGSLLKQVLEFELSPFTRVAIDFPHVARIEEYRTFGRRPTEPVVIQ